MSQDLPGITGLLAGGSVWRTRLERLKRLRKKEIVEPIFPPRFAHNAIGKKMSVRRGKGSQW
jgi:hypothetical protein